MFRSAAFVALLLTACAGESTTPPLPEKVVDVVKPVEAVKVATPPAKANSKVWTLPSGHHPALLDPKLASETAPDVFKVRFETTKGSFVVEAHKEWAPVGVDRFYNMVKIGYFNDVKFFRAVDGFMVQFGISGYPAVNKVWQESRLQDDPPKQGNDQGYITFAQCGAPNCRSTQLFVNYKNNSFLDGKFPAFGKVVEGMDVVDSLYKGYGETPSGAQGKIQEYGNAFLEQEFPNLDSIKSASIVE
ncbi:MAG: peptidyl-prolyl cis-trans isomerase A (cyclophilin A) [Kiritimatiellia bacterium]|jgi:peptidyl-prolyl cis-trans isomerase A (cyclophilin A)